MMAAKMVACTFSTAMESSMKNMTTAANIIKPRVKEFKLTILSVDVDPRLIVIAPTTPMA